MSFIISGETEFGLCETLAVEQRRLALWVIHWPEAISSLGDGLRQTPAEFVHE